MRSEPDDPMHDEELYEILQDALIEPLTPPPAGVEARYQEMIRAHFAHGPVQHPGWRSLSMLTACVSAVLSLALAPGLSIVFVLTTVICAGMYVSFLRFAAGRAASASAV
jgi:hypothetical protein